MNAIAFDTHAHVKRLIGAGLTEDQAEAVVDAVRQTADLAVLGHLATKADLMAEIQSIRSELQTARAELEVRISALKGELIWWVIGTGVVTAVAHDFAK